MPELTPQQRIKLRRRACTRIALALADLPEMKDRCIDTERIELIVDREMPQHLADAQAESDEFDKRMSGPVREKEGPSLFDRLRGALGLMDKSIDLKGIIEAAIERIEKSKIQPADAEPVDFRLRGQWRHGGVIQKTDERGVLVMWHGDPYWVAREDVRPAEKKE